jgi:integrase
LNHRELRKWDPQKSMEIHSECSSWANIRAIQLILGHSSLQSTGVYIHLSTRALLATQSPLDLAPMATTTEPAK